MAVTVSLRGKTQVKKVVVGKPIRRIETQTTTIENIQGLDVSDREDGSVLVYNGSSSSFEATKLLEKQEINGGQY
jgi:RNase H-fold protein (predicted Holliday junction resolvase)